ncbi:MAG: IS481 family transposase [Thermodesulfobacteriota bacterium]
MNKEIKQRFVWVKLYLETGNAGLVCRRCGISRHTLRKWVRRYKEAGIEGLKDLSRRPKHSPKTKVFEREEELILTLRKRRKLGARRLQSEIKRHHEISYSIATIHKVLKRNNAGPLKRYKRKKDYKRYSRPIPGERVQIDTCKIAPGLYQYTAVDDCTRFRVLGLYKKRTASNTLLFLERLIEQMPFSIQRIQTDRGKEFIAYKVQEQLMEYSIKFRPIKSGPPHLNGKVERSQRTDLEEFYPTVDLNDPDLEDRLEEWQFYYNWQRPHGSLNGKTPVGKHCELINETPLWDEVIDMYDISKEHIQDADYKTELLLRKLKRSM